MILDQPKYRLIDESWQGPEEILRIDNVLRKKLNLPKKGAAFAQPWSDERAGRGKPVSVVQLAFKFETDIDISSSYLALEEASERT